MVSPIANGFAGGPTAVPAARVASIVAAQQKQPEKGLPDLVAKMNVDDTFKLAMEVIMSKIEGAAVSIDVVDGPPSERELADLVASNLRKSWEKVVPKGRKAIEWGRAAFEQVWAWDAKASYFALADLFFIPWTLSQPIVRDGFLAGVKVGQGDNAITLGRNAIWWLAIDETPDNPHGVSRYKGGPEKILEKRETFETYESVWMNRFSIGNGVAYCPREYPPSMQGEPGEINPSGYKRDPREDTRKAIEDTYAGGVMILPSETYPQTSTRLFEVELGRALQDDTPLQNRGKTLDVRALRSMGVPERSVTQDTDTGSYALAKEHVSVLNSVCNGLLSQMTESFQRYVVSEARRVNGLQSTLETTYHKIGDDADEQAAEIIKTSLQSPTPPALSMIALDFERLLENSGLPVAKDVRDRIAQLVEKTLATPTAPML